MNKDKQYHKRPAWVDRGYTTDEEYAKYDPRVARMRKAQRYSKNDERLGRDHAHEMAHHDY